ncbi:MAG: hypothetical protein KDB82_11535 [Planctomycetes bacterium]|nr:hypothetical protein [Planctomycetota bacterium]
MKSHHLVLGALMLVAILAGCAHTPEPRYGGPTGSGRLIYLPGTGIIRKGAERSSDEEMVFRALQTSFDNKDWAKAILYSENLTDSFPEGTRAVEAILLRIRARLEYGRSRDPDAGAPKSVALDQWLFLYLAPIYDSRLQKLMLQGEEFRTVINDLRAKDIGDFVNELGTDADSLYDTNQLLAAVRDCRTLVTYYLPALDLREFRADVAELTRDIAWLSYAARDFDQVIALCDDLLVMNPAPSVKADALFIEGQAQRRNGAHALAANTFGYLFSGAGLRDTDTRWRPYALMWQIKETMDTSKGHTYDLVPYERAMELLGEYELYMLENPNISDATHEEFINLMTSVYDVMVERDLNSADQYSRLGEGDAADYYAARAAEWEAKRDKRVAELRKAH